ncbi:MAG: chromosomal replication initiator protein DnaA [Candidatus Magnetoovum sp. WYHC-5]|nr:chromosomal replication initiator protein DnaA [Candidatus Magnetoovum sp. WYHC-5]
MDTENIWQRCAAYIEERVGAALFKLWFEQLRVVRVEEDRVLLRAPNKFYVEWLNDNYLELLNDAFEEILFKAVNIDLFADTDSGDKVLGSEDILRAELLSIGKDSSGKPQGAVKGVVKGINLRYTFENFVVGPSNQFARAAALAVGDSVGKTYNPLFIYGDVGLGKTHIIHAIGNRVVQKNKKASVIYVTTEQFTNEVVTSIRHEKMSELKQRYRNVDILLIDDIQFIANKVQTQEEFFHTFNALYEKQKQIVLSSDRPPKELGDITDRLKSRFSMGLIADVQPPGVELKMAILQNKAETHGVKLPSEVAYYLATRIRSNIRELEGCLTKLAAHASISGEPITQMLAHEVLKDVFQDDETPINMDGILKIVCEYYGVSITDIKAKKRTKDVTVPRQVAMYLARELTEMSLIDVGKNFGGKDHATVIYACNKVEEKIKEDENFKRTIEKLRNRIKP